MLSKTRKFLKVLKNSMKNWFFVRELPYLFAMVLHNKCPDFLPEFVLVGISASLETAHGFVLSLTGMLKKVD